MTAKTNSISVYDYTSYREFPADYYSFRKKRTPSFSYRGFAARAGISSSGLYKEVADGNRGLIDSASSDPDGAFMFENVSRGSYRIDAHCRAWSLRTIIPDITVADAPVSLADRTVLEAGSLHGGAAPQPPLKPSVAIVQSPSPTLVDADGRYTIESLPPGVCTLVLLVNRPGYPGTVVALDSQTVAVESGQMTVTDSMGRTLLQ